MTALAPVADRLAKLIPRLASDHDGEVVATARAIGRSLQAAGFDWHALAAAVTTEPAPVVLYRDTPLPPTPKDWEQLVLLCIARGDQLPERERDFVRDCRGKFIFGAEPSEKQAAWLRSIYAKIVRAAA